MSDANLQQEIDAFVRQVFEQNYEQLRLETGGAISPDSKETALNQVLLYWKVLKEIAENVTDTEVRLSLPRCETPQEREYTIEGVVDILRAQDRTVMYDIKTQDADYVRANLEMYEQQLNVYAYIWQELRKQRLDEMAIIATDYPEAVQEALSTGDPAHLEYALKTWNPVVPIEYDVRNVEETIKEFGSVVDAIEENRFAPRTVEDLQGLLPGAHKARFATRICLECDARFSCSSYRQYAWQGPRISERSLAAYYSEQPIDSNQENWRTAGLDASSSVSDLRSDFSNR